MLRPWQKSFVNFVASVYTTTGGRRAGSVCLDEGVAELLCSPCPSRQSSSSNFHVILLRGGILMIKDGAKVGAYVKFFVFIQKCYLSYKSYI